VCPRGEPRGFPGIGTSAESGTGDNRLQPAHPRKRDKGLFGGGEKGYKKFAGAQTNHQFKEMNLINLPTNLGEKP